ncbi:MAG: tetratricopeptide repeat protein, partial [Janthinobacterium lividum]
MLLDKENSFEDFLQASKTPKPLGDAMRSLILATDLNRGNARLILSWLVVALRPLTVAEIKSLLGINLKKWALPDPDMEEDVIRACGLLVVVRNETVRFSHEAIKDHLLEMSARGEILLPLKDAHCDFTLRLLALVSSGTHQHHDPTFDDLEFHTVEKLFHAQDLLGYAARYWPIHFTRSSLQNQENVLDLPLEFSTVFPASTLFSILERMCWMTQTLMPDTTVMHSLALRIRREVFGDKHESVLQSLINLATAHMGLSQEAEASVYFFQASILSQDVFGKSSIITSTCADFYLSCTEPIPDGTSDDVLTCRQDMLKILIEACKSQCGKNSEDVSKYQRALGCLYMDMHERKLAAALFHEICDDMVDQYGHSAFQTTRAAMDLLDALQKDTNRDEAYFRHIQKTFEVAERGMDLADPRRVLVTAHLAEAYESRGDHNKAEELYVMFWQNIVGAYRAKETAETQKGEFEIAIAYIKFLRRCGRDVEASNILLGLWSEYEGGNFESPEITGYLIQLGELLKCVNLPSVALSVFSLIWSNSKKVGGQDSIEALQTAVSIAELVRDIQSQSNERTPHLLTTTAVLQKEGQSPQIMDPNNETMLREVFEIIVSRSTRGHIDESTIRICESVSAYYAGENRWPEAATVTEEALRIISPSLIDGRIDMASTNPLPLAAIMLVERLAHCLDRSERFLKAEQAYLSAFQMAKSALPAQDELVTRTSQALIKFYEKTSQMNAMFRVYKELVIWYHSTLGPKDPLVIKTLYTLGSLSIAHKQKDTDKTYREIMISLNNGTTVCHPDALEAALALSGIFSYEKRWGEEKEVCELLWRTFTERCQEYKLGPETAGTIYQRYIRALEKESTTDYSVLRRAAEDFFHICKNCFDIQSEVVIKAALEFAHISERREKHREDAIATYEEIIRNTIRQPITANMSNMLSSAKDRLAQLYVSTLPSRTAPSSSISLINRSTVHSSLPISTSSSLTPTSNNIQKAIKLYSEKYKESKHQHGPAHSTTLANLSQLVKLYKENGTKQSHGNALSELRDTTIEIVSKDTQPRSLTESARQLASIYTGCGYGEHGNELMREVRRQLISRDTRQSDSFGFKLDQSLGRGSYVFVASFEETLQGSKQIRFSDLMSDLLAETVLYERYTLSNKLEQRFETRLRHGTHLRSFYLSRDRQNE